MNVLRDFLQERRENLNQRFRLRWLSNRSMEAEAFLASYRRLAESYLESAQSSGASHSIALDGIYELLLQVHATRNWSEDDSGEDCASFLEECMAAFPALTSTLGFGFLGRMLNAFHSLRAEGIQPWRWLELLKRLRFLDREVSADGPQLARFYRIIAGLSWLAGMAHLRSSALAVFSELSEPEVAALFPRVNDTTSFSRWLESMQKNPWAGQEKKMPLLLGGFRGFGFPFARPPQIVMAGSEPGGGLLVFDSNRHFLVFADRFGSSIQPAKPGAEQSDPLSVVQQSDALSAIKESMTTVPREVSGAVLWNGALVATSAESHYIWMLPGYSHA